MENREISRIFDQIADVLELKDENVFRIRAYRTAAQNVLGLSRQLSEIYEKAPEELGNIPGIGKDLKEKIIEMVTTGKLKYHKDLLKEFPQGFLDLLNISGLGPKKLKKLKDVLGVKDVEDLEKACKEKKLEAIEGMGVKTQEKLLEAIAYYKKQAGRMLLPEAAQEASEIMSYLERSELFTKLEIAGSLRRGKETIGDIDILAAAPSAGKAMDYFARYPGMASVIAKGETKSSLLLRTGVQVDLRVIDSPLFGAALVYFTGSQGHNIKLRTLAKNKGRKVSEYGVFTVDPKTGKEKLIAAKTEKEVYVALGMEWIPPELREDTGEIEAAMSGKLPASLVELEHLKGDLHLHTTATDGRNTIEEMIHAAKEKGYEYIAITDHSKHVKVANGLDEKALIKHIENIRKISGKIKGIKVLTGVEVDILKEGDLDIEDDVLKELDIVIASVHSYFQMDMEAQTDRVLKALDNKYVNVLAHPSGRLITQRSPMQLDFDKVFEGARDRGIFLEINTHGKRIDLNDVHCRRAKEIGAKVVINTDAHEISHLGQIVFGVIAARRGWIEKKDVLNTKPLGGMLKALKR